MSTFQFSTSPDITVGANSCQTLGAQMLSLGVQHALVVSDPIIRKLGLLDSSLQSLADKGIQTTLYTDVQEDPPEQVIVDAAASAKSKGCDGVVGLGGGSSMDTAKLVSVLINGEQTLQDMYGVDLVTNPRVPLVQIPTTAGTGSEVTMVAIVTTGGTTKAGVVSRTLLADRVILDPMLTVGLPAAVTAATGIDAMVHAIEAYTSSRLKNPLSDMLARQALQLLAGNIRKVVDDGSDLAAREAMLLGAMLAGQAFANAPVAAVHALAYPLGGNFHIPHGLSNSLVLPHVLRFNGQAAGQLYLELAPLILTERSTAHNGDTATAALADYFLQLAADLGLQTQLRQMNIVEADLNMLADQAMLQQRLLINNPRPVELHDALNIYQQAF